jgi:beta-glucuronidase
LTEYGADAIPGQHAQPPEMFNQKSYMVGEHIWNLCDFKTSQGITRMGGFNYKGIFTRDRRPKLAAHRVRDLWKKQA